MDIISLLGILLAIASIYFGAPDISLNPKTYLELDSFIFVFVGSLSAMLISSSFNDTKQLLKLMFLGIIGKQNKSPQKTVDIMLKLCDEAIKTSKQNLPNLAKQYKNKFLKEATNMVASGLDEPFIIQTLDNTMNETEKRHDIMINKIKSIGTYASMFGMTGTILGVIQVLKDVKDIENIVSGLSLALLTTLYGLLLSSIVYLPMSKKLRQKSDHELLEKYIIREGIKLIINNVIPIKAKFYLTAYIEQKNKNNAK